MQRFQNLLTQGFFFPLVESYGRRQLKAMARESGTLGSRTSSDTDAPLGRGQPPPICNMRGVDKRPLTPLSAPTLLLPLVLFWAGPRSLGKLLNLPGPQSSHLYKGPCPAQPTGPARG